MEGHSTTYGKRAAKTSDDDTGSVVGEGFREAARISRKKRFLPICGNLAMKRGGTCEQEAFVDWKCIQGSLREGGHEILPVVKHSATRGKPEEGVIGDDR